MIYITGVGFSGTTFLLQLFRALGCETGAPLRGAAHKGQEWVPFVELATKVGAMVGRLPEPFTPTWSDMRYAAARRIATTATARVPGLPDLPEVVKCPEYGQALVLDRLPIEPPVLVAHRDLTQAVSAWQRDHPLTTGMDRTALYNALATAFGHLIDRLETAGLDYRVLMYPRAVHDAGYVYERVRPHLGGRSLPDFARVHARVANPGLVHEFNPTGEETTS